MALQATTPQQQAQALDIIIRMALTNDRAPLSNALPQLLAALPRDAGLRVANIMVMLAGAAVPDTVDWRNLLAEHMTGANDA